MAKVKEGAKTFEAAQPCEKSVQNGHWDGVCGAYCIDTQRGRVGMRGMRRWRKERRERDAKTYEVKVEGAMEMRLQVSILRVFPLQVFTSPVCCDEDRTA